MSFAIRLRIVALLFASGVACGGVDPGATSGTGGAGNATGGNNSSGGSENTTGGMPSMGGTPAGNSNGGSASGGQRPATGGAAATPATLLPWKVGNSWTYRVTASGAVTEKETTIEAAEPVGGSGPNQSVTAFRVVTRKGASGSDESISWQGVVGEKVVRYREQSFGAMTGLLELEEHWSPYKLHVDSAAGHAALGAMWVERYDETKMPVGAAAATASASDVWSTISGRQSVTVPAGTFDAVVFQKSSGSGSVKTYYYAQGIGKVKEVGASQVEELTAFTLAP